MNTGRTDSPKVYVAVEATFTSDGTMMPQEITWEDGRRYRIDRITAMRQAAARTGGVGDRYTIWIGRQQSYLFFERSSALVGNNIGRWFVERRG
ncbi:MAG: hypothetical protein IJK56_03230 [Firmicutes bacterium]|nr:hypothetical protein [Bacillota bacterium]